MLFTLDVSNSLASLVSTSKCPNMITEMNPTTTEMVIPAYSCNDRADRFFDLSPFMMLETLQTGNRGELMMSAIDNLESAVSSVEEAIDYLNEARGE